MEPPDGMWDAFCARFPYQETDDQLRAIGETLIDLSSGTPMDRLVCGDVGFGKTEVALRAAFIAAMEGKQVALVELDEGAFVVGHAAAVHIRPAQLHHRLEVMSGAPDRPARH